MRLEAGLLTVRQQIAERLRNEILSGRLSEGERLTESKLAKRFGVSRGPIREVLAHLCQEGLLLLRPNCGVQVAPSAPECMRELIVPVRRMVETYALKMFFVDLNEEDFASWEDILRRMERACLQDDVVLVTQQDVAFHRYLVQRSGQPDLLALWHAVVARIRRHLREAISSVYGHNLIGLIHEHEELLRVFRAGDWSRAVAALDKHIE